MHVRSARLHSTFRCGRVKQRAIEQHFCSTRCNLQKDLASSQVNFTSAFYEQSDSSSSNRNSMLFTAGTTHKLTVYKLIAKYLLQKSGKVCHLVHT